MTAITERKSSEAPETAQRSSVEDAKLVLWKKRIEGMVVFTMRVTDVLFSPVGLFISIATPIFSAISIWLSVIGIAFTLFSGVEPFINVAHWVRFLTIRWRDFSHHVWDILSPYVGFQVPIDLKDFATFVAMIFIALVSGILSRGHRLVLNEAIIGIRMAIYGISHAIGPARQADISTNFASRARLLFFEIDQFLSKYVRTFWAYSLPSLIIFNVAFRISIILIPMIILVPEAAFEQHLGVRATRVEYIILAFILSYSAAVMVVVSGVLHVALHYVRAVIELTFRLIGVFGSKTLDSTSFALKEALRKSGFFLTYASNDPVRQLWNEQYFLARLSASLIRPNWVMLPVSQKEALHRRYDPFLYLSERRYADAAFVDRITKGLFLFFIIYGLNWVSINGDNIVNMFGPPVLPADP